MDREQVLASYLQAWSQREEQGIRAALTRCLSVSGTYQNPIIDPVQGITGLTDLILDLPVMFPGATLRPTNPPDLHHDVACLPWQLTSTTRIRTLGHDFGTKLEGIDLVEFDADGRIRRVCAFFGFERSRNAPAAPVPVHSHSRPASGRSTVIDLDHAPADGHVHLDTQRDDHAQRDDHTHAHAGARTAHQYAD